MKTNLTWSLILLTILVITGLGCSTSTTTRESITRQAKVNDPPYFEQITWPAVCSEIPEGRFIITGRLLTPAGPAIEKAIKLFVFNGACGEAGGPNNDGLQGSDLPGVDLGSVQEQLTRYLENERGGQNTGDEWIPGCQVMALWGNETENNEYAYFHPEDGRFRIDFDLWLRMNPGVKMMVLVGEDSLGQTIAVTNIVDIPDYAPGAYEATRQARHIYGEKLTGLCQAMLQALSFYPIPRRVDIESISATNELITQAYMGPEVMDNYASIGEEWYTRMETVAPQIHDIFFRSRFRDFTGFIRDAYVSKGEIAQASHFQRLWAESDPAQNFWDSVGKLQEMYGVYSIATSTETTPEGNLEVHILITCVECNPPETIADFVMIASISAPLVVSGTIGEHIITSHDYNPYFIKMFDVLFNNGFVPVIAH